MKNEHFVQYNSPEERFNRTVSVLIIMTMAFMIFYFVSLSWFGESDFEEGVLIVGNISLSVDTDLDFTGIYLEPGKTYTKDTVIIGNDNSEDLNTNDAYIRVKLETNVKVDGNNIIVPIYDEDDWIYDGAAWYYYIGFINNTTSATFNTALQVIADLGNDLQNTQVEIALTVSAIQRDYQAHLTDDDWKNSPAAWKTAIATYDTTN